MTREELLKCLREEGEKSKTNKDPDSHYRADKLLLTYIGDEEIEEAFLAIERWYD